jgi:alpha-beta hydrolase superfamily lysophospholipase
MAQEPAQPRSLTSKIIRRAGWLLCVFILAAAVAWSASRPQTPDEFYSDVVPESATSGMLLKSEPFTRAVPDGGRAWRILYVTTRSGKFATASAIVVVPNQPTGNPLPVIAWAHGTSGIAAGCAPSILAEPFDNVPDVQAVVREGWAFVGTDYPGLGTSGGHAYLVGEDAARAVLDSVRAARQLQDTQLSDRVVVWGHSQGGNSALWTGMRADEAAPELKLLGVAALAPASDLKGLVAASKGSLFGKIVSSYLIHAYARAYSDVIIDEYVGGVSRLLADDIASRCAGGYATLFSVLEAAALPSAGIFSRDPTGGPLGKRLAENTPSNIIPAPVLIAQGEADDLVLPRVQQMYVTARCRAGQPIDYRGYAGRDHLSVVAPDSPLAADLLAWTRDRFGGKPSQNTCP